MGTLRDELCIRASKGVDAPALLAPGRDALDVGRLAELLDRVGLYLNDHGLGRGDRVAVLAEPGPEAAVAIAGVATHATCVPLNPDGRQELGDAVAASGAVAVVAPSPAAPDVRAVAARLELALLEWVTEAGAPAGDLRLRGGNPGPARLPGPADEDDTALLLRTSGSTSRPKLVPATHRQLMARAERARVVLGLREGDRCVCPMPLCFAHGLYSGLWTPLATGGSVVRPEAFDEDTFRVCLDELAATWCTAGAAHQQAILGWLRRRPDTAARHSLRFSRSGAASLPVQAARDLEGLLGIPVVECYSSSETGVICANPPEGERRPGTVGPVDPAGVMVVGEDGGQAPAGEQGEILVCGPGVFDGYEGSSELTEQAFRGDWFRTGDIGLIDEAGFLTLTGRVRDVINRGGAKVAPAEIEAALQEHPRVAEAVSFPIPHPTLGQDVGAAVRLRDGNGATDLAGFVAGRLDPYKRPRRIVELPEIPKGPTGKPVRRVLAAQLGLDRAAPGADAAPSDGEPLERRLSALFARTLERTDAALDDDFFLLGGDSLSAIELLAAIEDDLGAGLGLDDLAAAPTPRALANALRHGADDQVRSGVLTVNPGGRLPPLFVVGGRSGHSLRAMLVCRDLGAEQPAHGLEPPGMDWSGMGERPGVPGIAARYLERVRELHPSGRYRLLGVSFGGLVVFEIARQLRQLGEEVEFLGLVDTEPPSVAWEDGDAPAVSLEDDEDGPQPGGRIGDAAARVAEVHVQARRDYSIDAPIDAELTYFGAAAAGTQAGRDRRGLWARAARRGYRLIEVPGVHGSLDREPQFSGVLNALRACLTGDPPPGADPAWAFERSYRIVRDGAIDVIRDSSGRDHVVDPDHLEGRLRSVRRLGRHLLARGWACDARAGRPASTVVAFAGDRFAGYTACGILAPNLERRNDSTNLRYAGFRLRLDPDTDIATLRVFALSDEGGATELRHGRRLRERSG